jgi:hypothetical protein
MSSPVIERIKAALLRKISLPVWCFLGSLINTPLVQFVSGSNPYILLDGYFDYGLFVGSVVLGTCLAFLAVKYSEPDTLLQLGLKTWLGASVCYLAFIVVTSFLGGPKEVVLDRKGQMVMTSQTISEQTSGFTVVTLTCNKVLIPKILAIRGVTICIADPTNYQKPGHCYLESDKVAHVEISGQVFAVDLSRPRTIVSSELFAGGGR